MQKRKEGEADKRSSSITFYSLQLCGMWKQWIAEVHDLPDLTVFEAVLSWNGSCFWDFDVVAISSQKEPLDKITLSTLPYFCSEIWLYLWFPCVAAKLLSYKERSVFCLELWLTLALMMGTTWCWWRSNTRHNVSFIKEHSANGQWYSSSLAVIGPSAC